MQILHLVGSTVDTSGIHRSGPTTRLVVAGFLVLSLAVLQGCGPKSEPAPPGPSVAAQASPQAILDEWKTLVREPDKNMNNPQCVVLAAMLAARAPERLNDMVDMLIDPATAPQSKLIILTSLESVLQPSLIPRLLDLTDPKVDGTVRSGVTMLLAGEKDPAVTKRLKELSADGDRRVQLAALNGLAIQGDANAQAKLRELYFERDMPAPFKERIALTFSMYPQPDGVALLADALGLTTIQTETRTQIASALGTLGDSAALPALNACIEGKNPEELKAVARDAVAAIQAKNANGSQGEVPAETANDGKANS